MIISNPSATDTIYLNGDISTVVSTFLTVDDTPFIDNAPLSLAPGADTGPTPFELFDVTIDPTTPAGNYDNNLFSILGGPDGTSLYDLVDVPFNVTVTTPTAVPELDASWLMLTVLITLGMARLRGKWYCKHRWLYLEK